MTPDEYCQQKAAASGSSFYYSFLFLPAERRRAITALYAFCREVDDVVDETSEMQVAAAKLAYCDRTMALLRERDPVVTNVELEEDVAEIEYSLGQYYRDETIGMGEVPPGLDGAIRAIFEDLGTAGETPPEEPLAPAGALIRRLGKSAAVIISTHLVEDVAAACDRVHVLADGRLRFSGTPDELSTAAATDAVGDSPMERGYATVLGGGVAA